MKISFFRTPKTVPTSFLEGLLFFTFLIGLGLTQPNFFVGKQQFRELLAPPLSVQYFTFGFRESFADLLWIRSIQDFEYCEKKIQDNRCKGNGWLAQTLDLVTDLSPSFRMAYSAGGLALTVMISDIEGASKIFDKGVARLPKDWILIYKAAYHALYEEKDKAKAAKLMEQAARNGAPDWVYMLSTRLYTEGGQREMAERLLHEMEQSELDPNIIEGMRKKLSKRPSP